MEFHRSFIEKVLPCFGYRIQDTDGPYPRSSLRQHSGMISHGGVWRGMSNTVRTGGKVWDRAIFRLEPK